MIGYIDSDISPVSALIFTSGSETVRSSVFSLRGSGFQTQQIYSKSADYWPMSSPNVLLFGPSNYPSGEGAAERVKSSIFRCSSSLLVKSIYTRAGLSWAELEKKHFAYASPKFTAGEKSATFQNFKFGLD